jgi:vancomycin resistance protein YoaR
VKPRAVLLVVVPLLILALPLIVYWADRAAANGEISRNVTIAGIDLGGLSPQDALLVVQAHEARLLSEPALFVVNGKRYQLDPGSVALQVNEERIITSAMSQRRDGGALARFTSWLDGFSTPIEVDLAVSYDEDAIADQLDAWETDAIPNPAYEGDVRVVRGDVLPIYPRDGLAIDRDPATELVETALAEVERPETKLPVITSNPELTNADIDAAVAEVHQLIENEVILRSNAVNFLITFEPDQLANAARVEVTAHPAAIEVGFDPDVIAGILEPRRSEFELAPVSAAFKVDLDSDVVNVIESKNGTKMDLEGVVASLRTAARGDGFGPFPVAEGDEPSFTTEEAEAYLPMGKVSEFTTDHPCCEDRVTNIQRMAEIVDGAVVMPGRTFSINEHVGRRTEDKGFVAAPAIIGGVPYCCDHPANIGGGVSQFGTTFYNAVFFGCYEDVEHSPHSLWFSRYPEGREATLGDPKPDVIFRNDSAAPVIIKTRYTDRSITVAFYGNNGGKECAADTSERRDIVEFDDVLVADTEGELLPGEEELLYGGKKGWTVTVTRVVTMPDGTVVREEPFTWRYNKLDKTTTVHPCMVSGQPVACPIRLPSVVGTPYEEAFTTLVEQGFIVAQATVPVEDPAQNGIVQEMAPAAGEWLGPGASITLTVGVFGDGGVDPGDGGGDPGDGGGDPGDTGDGDPGDTGGGGG